MNARIELKGNVIGAEQETLYIRKSVNKIKGNSW